MDDIVGLQDAIGRTVALQQQVVEVEFDCGLGAAAQPNLAEAAGRRRPAGLEERMRDRRQAAHAVGTGALDEAGHVDPLAAQLPQRDAQVEVAEHLCHPLADGLVEIRIAHPGDQHRPDARNRDPPGSVDHQAQIGDHRAPQGEHEFVARTDEVIRRHCWARLGRTGEFRLAHQVGTKAPDLDRRGKPLHESIKLPHRPLHLRKRLPVWADSGKRPAVRADRAQARAPVPLVERPGWLRGCGIGLRGRAGGRRTGTRGNTARRLAKHDRPAAAGHRGVRRYLGSRQVPGEGQPQRNAALHDRAQARAQATRRLKNR